MELREFDKPTLGPKDLLMKIKYCGICASDIHTWEGAWQPRYPYIPGHEFIAEVAEAGEEALEWRGLNTGDQVAVEMIIPCYRCKWCMQGLYNLCIYDREYGYNIPTSTPQTPSWGGYSQYLYVPENAIVHKFHKRVDWKEGAITEPLAVSCRAVNLAQISSGNSVAVVGPGMIGLTAVVAAKAAGANPVILLGTRDYRLRVGEALGADYTINVSEGGFFQRVMELTDGIGSDVVLETAGAESAQALSFKLARKGGKVVLVGLSGEKKLTITPDSDIVTKELTVKGSMLSAHAYQQSMRIIESGTFPLKRLITHVFPLKDVDRAYELILKREDNVLKVLLDPWLQTE